MIASMAGGGGVVLVAAWSASDGSSCLVTGMTELSGSRHFGEAEPALNFDLWPIYEMNKPQMRLLGGIYL